MKISELRESLFDWIEEVTGLSNGKIILTNQNGPRPNPPFISYTTNNHKTKDLPFTGDTNSDGEQTLKTYSQFVLSLQSYGSSEPLEKISDAFMSSKRFNESGIVFYDKEDILSVPETLDSRIESRFNLDIFCRVGKHIIDDVGIIEETEISGSVGSQDTTFNIGG